MSTILKTTEDERLVGRASNGDKVFVRVELTQRGPLTNTEGKPIVFQTIDHQYIDSYKALSISGVRVERHKRNGYSYGQIPFSAEEFTPSRETVSRATVSLEIIGALETLWTTKHLNGMHAECIHQTPNAHLDEYGPFTGALWELITKKQTALCPEGYGYGSSWLIDVLSDEEVETIVNIIEALSSQPKYQGN